MKKSGILNLYLRFFIIFLIIISIAVGMIVYLLYVSIIDKESNANWSSWPVQFTSSFYEKINFNEGIPELTDTAVGDLEQYNLSFQMINQEGDVVLKYNEPDTALNHYSPMELVQLYKTGGNDDNYTIFIGSTNNSGVEWVYIIGFPAKISKVTMYFNHKNFLNIKIIIVILFISIIVVSIFYLIYTNKILLKIIWGIKSIELKTDDSKADKITENYVPLEERGIYKDIFKSINVLNSKLKISEEERKKTQRLREEWIANISHDLKTPLSPIKGYAEILADYEYNLERDEAGKYGEIILRNVDTVEMIVENLNFTYQLKNGMLPINLQEGNIVRLLKEVVISILNNPKYENRNISFYSSQEKINFKFDNGLLHRAFVNLLYNSVIHNPIDTIIKVSIEQNESLIIKFEDNGRGMDEEDMKKLFDRYYRGTNTSTNVKGSGLGMAIAKQIIEAHGGKISVKSKIDNGTSIIIVFAMKAAA